MIRHEVCACMPHMHRMRSRASANNTGRQKGKVSVKDLWAYGCGVLRSQMPDFSKYNAA